jgi:hypothetical protein
VGGGVGGGVVAAAVDEERPAAHGVRGLVSVAGWRAAG